MEENLLMNKVNIGINGYGRIGRVIHRICDENPNIEVLAINDINEDIDNVAYLANYDSTYGPRNDKLIVDKNTLKSRDINTAVFCEDNISNVPWKGAGVSIVIDSSGILSNLKSSRDLRDQVEKVIVTNSPDESLIDKTIIFGVNHDSIDVRNDFLISSSICDAIAFAPLAELIDREFHIKEGFLTTLHPWLGYQNLLDGPSKSYAQPGKIYDNYALGRTSVMTLIPKYTSAISATTKVLTNLEDKFTAYSYRIPTSIVSSADATIKVEKEVSLEHLTDLLVEYEKNKPGIIHNNYDALVSTDFIKTNYSVIVDHRFIQVKNNYIKLMTWYDNEWGYSSRVVDLIDYLGSASNNG
tara:strand:- start:28279 stop:29343 length:1065 start_codon:yes stop_codon:yes gene_type:complete